MRSVAILLLVLSSIFCFSRDKLQAKDVLTSASHRYLVKISHSQCRLWLYEQNGDQLRLVGQFAAGTAKVGLPKYPLGRGFVTEIDFSPVWRPTAYSRWYFASKKGIYLPSMVPFGHKLNYMGAFRISLSHDVPGKGKIYRIHGVRPGDEACVGTRVSGGCIRMLNEEGLEIARKVSVGTPVEIVP